MTFDEQEEIAKDWIRHNPHVALCEAVKAHDEYYGCKCKLEEIAPMIKRAYKL